MSGTKHIRRQRSKQTIMSHSLLRFGPIYINS